jgi:putative ABC transport system permease protein
MRSLLTTLGVLFGTSSVIAMLAIGEGASSETQEQIRALGSQNILLRSVKPPEDPNQSSQSRTIIYGLTHDDRRRVEATFPALEAVVPVRDLSQELRVLDRVVTPRVLATLPEYLSATGRLMLSGRFISERDLRGISNVIVLGDEIARRLFPFNNPLGEQVKVGAEYFEVVGIVAPRPRYGDDAAKAGEDVTGEAFVPLSTGLKWYGELTVKRRAGSMEMEQIELHELILQVETPEEVPMVAAAAREMLTRFHEQDDYEVVVPLELLARAEATKRIFNIVLGSIAGISLLVGGIGIMNVMLATVTERTREIGIRRALGAKRRHIVSQFLVETVVLSVGGGAMGVLLGLLIPIAVEHFADMRTIVTPAAPLLAFGISAGIGVLFGLYPAWRAAHMDPVDALRHE